MKKIVSMFLSFLLFLNFLTPGICAAAQTNQPGEGQVEVTNITTGAQNVTDGQRVTVNVDFAGGRNVQPGTKLTINIPQPSNDKAGLYGVKSTFTIDGKTANGQDVKDIATVNVQNNQAVVTFNSNVSKLPNGFTGHFTFSVEAQWALEGTSQQTQDVKIEVNGKYIIIHIVPGTTTGPGQNPSGPITANMVEKVGHNGKNGLINWQIQGATAQNSTGNVVIHDTPNATPGATFIPSSFHLYITPADSTQQYQVGYTKLVQLGWLKVNGNSWSLSVPAKYLANTN